MKIIKRVLELIGAIVLVAGSLYVYYNISESIAEHERAEHALFMECVTLVHSFSDHDTTTVEMYSRRSGMEDYCGRFGRERTMDPTRKPLSDTNAQYAAEYLDSGGYVRKGILPTLQRIERNTR